MKPRAAWPGLLLGILACLGIIAAVAYARHEAEQARIRKARKAWEALEAVVKKSRKKTLEIGNRLPDTWITELVISRSGAPR